MEAPVAAALETARDRAEQAVRDVLSPPDPLKPGKKLPQQKLIDLSTGQLTGVLPEPLQQIKARGGWFGRIGKDPATNLSASVDDYILYDQRIFVNHPLVSCCLAHSGFEQQQQQLSARALVVQLQACQAPP